MYNNILTYLCFFVLCGLVVLDMWFCSSVALQIVCILLVCVVLIMVVYVAHKWHKGTYLSKEQQSNYQSYLSENLALQKELNHYQTKQATTKQNGSELQTLVLINRRLTAQIGNLQLRVHQQAEYNNELKIKLQTAQSTPILAMPVEQQTKLKKQKSA
jgi:ABC-type multidrug transport system fused ATPase/permease subunit